MSIIPSFSGRCDFESGHRALVLGQISFDRGFPSLSNFSKPLLMADEVDAQTWEVLTLKILSRRQVVIEQARFLSIVFFL